MPKDHNAATYHVMRLNQHGSLAQRHMEQKAERKGEFRPDRHSGTGHSIGEGPKKGGTACGPGAWGSVQDQIADGLEQVKQEAQREH
mmetsp:Transcript_23782/g.70607  ORF Transcript_23782/g.70607 Transcript_23782/m.70607 type:complete len:87 (-) Transcript_23782:519-779(-)